MTTLLSSIDLDVILMAAVFLLIVVTFLRDFKLTSGRSWLMLAGLAAFGGLLAAQWWKRKKLLGQFEARERQLKEVAEKYERAKADNLISEKAYEAARKELDAERLRHASAVAQAAAERDAGLADIDRAYAPGMSTQESIERLRRNLTR